MDRERELLHFVRTELDRTWVDMTPWRLVDIFEESGAVTGFYRVDIEKDLNPAAPHVPLMHGSTMYTIATYHTLLGMCFLVMGRRAPSFEALPEAAFPELRRRLIFASSKLEFRKPVMSPDVSMRMTMEAVTDKYMSHRLIFTDVRIDVNEGCQSAFSRICLDFRDELVPVKE